MYSEADLAAAVSAGAVSADAAQALRNHAAGGRALPVADEENFRLVTGFNDFFVSIAAIILLIAVGWIGGTILAPLAGALVAFAAWGLAEVFTLRRRMALPSIILLLAFCGGVAGMLTGFLAEYGDVFLRNSYNQTLTALLAAGIALVTAGAAWLHWRRFMVPITVAAGTAALVATVIALIVAAIGPDNFDQNTILSLVLVAGVAVFGFAMRWDRSDRLRETRRSDVAFWLHLLAAPMIAHALFSLLGISQSGIISIGAAVGVIALYLVFGVVALAVDRRALLVSALAYVLYAMTTLFREFGALELNVALTALVIGSALLLLSAYWQHARRLVVGLLPGGVQAVVPATAMA